MRWTIGDHHDGRDARIVHMSDHLVDLWDLTIGGVLADGEKTLWRHGSPRKTSSGPGSSSSSRTLQSRSSESAAL